MSEETLKEVNGLLGAVDGDTVKAVRNLIAYTRELEYKLQKCRDEVTYLRTKLSEGVNEQ
ncbi:MAG TPA: hypothetical protein ENI25_01095 [Epsilonproteobacteria bacterium]|nr:hypothetical protein [Campylobacterota bacterium]